MPNNLTSAKHCAIIGIVGRTNSGKSTLLNQILGEKISIVSPIVQTTRNTIRGILTEAEGQLVFLDTPGLHRSQSQLGTLMNRMARHSSGGVDILMVVFDASYKPQIEDDGWMRRVANGDQDAIFVLNKEDCKPFYAEDFYKLWESIRQEKNSDKKIKWLNTSATHNKGVDNLVAELFAMAPITEEYLFPEDILTDYPRKLAIADVIREKFFMRLRDELPHELGVKIEQIDEKPDNWIVHATVYVNRNTQKGIVIGHKGRLLKYVQQAAEQELSDVFETKINIELWVKVEKNWMKNFWLLQQMGYAGNL